jgi:hypothetical protein
MENSNNKIELVDKIIHFAEKAIYYVLSILILLFLAFEIVNLVHLFYVEVSESYIWVFVVDSGKQCFLNKII